MNILPSWIPFGKRASPDTVCIGHYGLFGLRSLRVPLFLQQTHLYCVGKSGQGKSKLLLSLLTQLIMQGQGCGIIDPHSDLTNDLLRHLAYYPKRRPWLSVPANRARVLYLDPSRTDYVVPANVLKSSTMTPYKVAETIIDCYKRVFPQTLGEAPRFAQVMRNTLIVLASRGLTLLELRPFLTKKSFRRKLLADFPDKEVTGFFDDEYERWGRDRNTFIGSTLNKVNAYLFEPSVRASLCASDNVLDFRKIIDQGKILICDLGGLTGETQQLYGSMLVANYERAAMSRRDMPEHQRSPYLLMIDEFPSFVSRDTKTLAQILSEIRKFNCYVALAHQTLSQTDSRMQGALENCDCQLAFKTGRDTAFAMAQQLYMPDPDLIKHEVHPDHQDRAHPLYEHISTQIEVAIQSLMRLKKRHMMVKVPDSDRLYHVKTPTVPRTHIAGSELEGYKGMLLKQVGKTFEELENERKAREPRQVPQTLMMQMVADLSGDSWEDAFYEDLRE